MRSVPRFFPGLFGLTSYSRYSPRGRRPSRFPNTRPPTYPGSGSPFRFWISTRTSRAFSGTSTSRAALVVDSALGPCPTATGAAACSRVSTDTAASRIANVVRLMAAHPGRRPSPSSREGALFQSRARVVKRGMATPPQEKPRSSPAAFPRSGAGEPSGSRSLAHVHAESKPGLAGEPWRSVGPPPYNPHETCVSSSRHDHRTSTVSLSPSRRAAMRALIARRLSIIGFVLAGLLLVVVAAVAYQRLQELKSASRQVEHTLAVEAELARTLSLVTDAESGQRGYLIPGLAPSLEPYESAVAGLPPQLERLRQLTSDNATQQERLRLLEGQVRRKLSELEATIVARKAGDTAAAGQIVTGGEGRQAMARIREVIDEMRAEEGRLLAERTAVQSRSLRIAIGVILGGFLLAMGLITSAVVLLNRVDRERDREASARAMAEQMAAATAVSEARLRVTLQSIGDGVVTTDDRGRVTMLNDVAQALTDWTEREARGRQIEDVLVLVNQHTRAPAENPVGRVLRE